MIFLAVALALNTEPKLPQGVTCEIIRAQVAQHGYARALIWARSSGYSWAQIKEARKCLK
jgi:hypothetical protein